MNRYLSSLLVVGLVLTLYGYFNSSTFVASSLQWTGLQMLEEKELDVFSRYEPTNVLRLDTRQLQQRLESHPWIQSADVLWRWPNRILIAVREHDPLGAISWKGQWFLLAEQGGLLPAPTEGQAHRLPLVTELDRNCETERQMAARVLGALPASLRDAVSEWNAKEELLITRNGTPVLLGPLTDLQKKFSLLESILADVAARQQQAVSIDLRVPRNPVVITDQ